MLGYEDIKQELPYRVSESYRAVLSALCLVSQSYSSCLFRLGQNQMPRQWLLMSAVVSSQLCQKRQEPLDR